MASSWTGIVQFLLECAKSFSHSNETQAKLDLAEKLLALTARMPEVESWPETQDLVNSAIAYAKAVGGTVGQHPVRPNTTEIVLPPFGGYGGGKVTMDNGGHYHDAG